MSLWRQIGFLVSCIMVAGCARTLEAPRTTPRPYFVNPLNAERLSSLESHAPELAQHLERLNAMARERGERGERDAAQEIATLAEVGLLSAELAFAQALECVASDEAVVDEAIEVAAADSIEEVDPADPAPRRRPRAVRDTPPEDSAEASPSQPDALRTRLAEMASVLGQMEPSPEVEQVQRTLIEADRALADGLLERAVELAEEARSLLSGERMQRVPDEEAFMRDAQERLGSRALRRGSRILVRLNDLVTLVDGRWNTRDASTISSLRALARVYRGERLTLVHISEDDDSSFVQDQSGLLTYLRERMQLSSERLIVAARQAAGAQGTYLVFRPERE